MTYNLLKKGLEVELYAGTESGEVLPLSRTIKDHFPNFAQEPDARNFEYITKACTNYNELFKEIIIPRIKVRKFLTDLGNLTLIPGSTLSLPFDKKFYFSDSRDLYYRYISKTYKTKVITTSLHINIGITDYKNLFKLICALRLDLSLLLALSASSCFYDGRLTNFYSYRWHNFPRNPDFIPFFTTHDQYINWTEEQIKTKTMFNVRHLWTGIRPNGPNRPYKLNRLEIRICDLVFDTKKILGIVALIETLVQKYLTEEEWPKVLNTSQAKLNKLAKLADKQEELISRFGLNATIWDWRNDSQDKAYKIIDSLYKDIRTTANRIGTLKHLNSISDILHEGNEATQFLNMYKKNKSIEATIQHFIKQFTMMDFKYLRMIKK